MSLIIRGGEIFVCLIFVDERSPRKLIPHENFYVYGISFFSSFLFSHLTSGALDSSPNRSVVMETLNVILDGMQELVSVLD